MFIKNDGTQEQQEQACSIPYMTLPKGSGPDYLIPYSTILKIERDERNSSFAKFATISLICVLAIAIICIVGLSLARFI